MPRAPDDRRGSEPSLNHGPAAEWPVGRRWQQWSGHGRSRYGEHAQAHRHEGRHLKVSTEDPHSWSLWTLARIVQALANLWTTVQATAICGRWCPGGPSGLGRPTKCVSADRRIDSRCRSAIRSDFACSRTGLKGPGVTFGLDLPPIRSSACRTSIRQRRRVRC